MKMTKTVPKRHVMVGNVKDKARHTHTHTHTQSNQGTCVMMTYESLL